MRSVSPCWAMGGGTPTLVHERNSAADDTITFEYRANVPAAAPPGARATTLVFTATIQP